MHKFRSLGLGLELQVSSFGLVSIFYPGLGLEGYGLDNITVTYHSAVIVTAVTHTSESCRNLFAQEN